MAEKRWSDWEIRLYGQGSLTEPKVVIDIGAWFESRIEVEPGSQGGSRAGQMTAAGYFSLNLEWFSIREFIE